MRRQIRRHSSRRSTFASSRRRLGRLWSRLWSREGQARSHSLLLDPPGSTQITLGLHSYRTAGGAEDDPPRSRRSARSNQEPGSPESPPSPLSSPSVDSPEVGGGLSPFEGQSHQRNSAHIFPPTPQFASAPPSQRRPSRKLVLELAVNLKGVSLRRSPPSGSLSPLSPSLYSSSSQTPRGGGTPPSASTRAEGDSDVKEGSSAPIK